ncbi:MAG: glycosyltransferase family 39 protein [Bacteroidetes bacterium]|nr:glycosyltransferase family 39 protein [Bacteroidota bacterium]
MKYLLKPFLPFWIISFATLLVLTVSSLVQDGMFMDAMLYTGVSRNLSLGLGSFWFPYFDPWNVIGIPSFHEQPPLGFGIQSLFFRVLGDHIFVERVYTFVTLGITALLIIVLWNQIFKKEPQYRAMGWLPVLLWITIPVCFWSYSNNMHENTMGLFVLLSILVMYHCLKSSTFLIGYWILAALFICMAALTKGIPGFFPIGFPFLYWLFIREHSFKKMALQTALLLGVILVVGLLLYWYPPSRESLSIYLFKRAFARIQSVHSVDSRFFIFFRLLSELIPAFCFTAFLDIISKLKRVEWVLTTYQRTAFLFLATGLSGSLPLMLTMVQNGFYFVPALPYFGLAFAILNVSPIYSFIVNIKATVLPYLQKVSVGIAFAVLAFIYSKIGHTVRDQSMLQDVHVLGKSLPAFTSLGAQTDVYKNSPLACYLVRYYNISLNRSDTNRYYLGVKMELWIWRYRFKK